MRTLRNDHTGPHTYFTTGADGGKHARTVKPGETFQEHDDRAQLLIENFGTRFADLTGTDADPFRDISMTAEQRAELDKLDDTLQGSGSGEPAATSTPGTEATPSPADTAAPAGAAPDPDPSAAKFTVEAGNNEVPVPGGSDTVTIPPGEYTQAELDAAIEAALATPAPSSASADEQGGKPEAPAKGTGGGRRNRS